MLTDHLRFGVTAESRRGLKPLLICGLLLPHALPTQAVISTDKLLMLLATHCRLLQVRCSS
jgi:hypothetical protein